MFRDLVNTAAETAKDLARLQTKQRRDDAAVIDYVKDTLTNKNLSTDDFEELLTDMASVYEADVNKEELNVVENRKIPRGRRINIVNFYQDTKEKGKFYISNATHPTDETASDFYEVSYSPEVGGFESRIKIKGENFVESLLSFAQAL